MTRVLANILSIAVVTLLMMTAALAQKRVALVIGNSNYGFTTSLANPRNDAADMSVALKRIGFEVTRAGDLAFDAMRKTLRNFSKKASEADMAVVFFAGHGIEVNKQNYLIPVDAKLETDKDISFEAIPLDLVLDTVSEAKSLRLVMLDACRNNPFAASMKTTSASRSIGRGLSRVEPSAGTLVSYAAKEGTIAADGTTRNSPYTKALLAHLEQPGREVQFLFRKVRDSVLASTGGRQEPFTYGSLPGTQIYLKKPVAPSTPAATAAPASELHQELSRLREQLLNRRESVEEIEALKKQLKAQQDALRALRLKQQKQARLPSSTRLQNNNSTNRQRLRPSSGLRNDDYVRCRMPGQSQPVTVKLVICRHRSGQVLSALSPSSGSSSSTATISGSDYVKCRMPGAREPVTIKALMCRRGGGRVLSAASSSSSALQRSSKSRPTKSANELLREGLAADKRKDYRSAARFWREAANMGDSSSMWNIGILYYNGQGFRRDYRSAAQWIARGLKGRSDLAAKFSTNNAKQWTRTFRMHLQRELRTMGLYAGPIDGSFGRGTLGAIRRLAAR